VVSVAVVGWGMSAKTFHLPFIVASEHFSLVAMVTSQSSACASAYPAIKCFTSIEELLADSIPDLIVLATPNHLHFEQAKLALQAGCNVLIDKPFVISVAQGEALCKISEGCGRQIFVYHNRRWDGDFMTLQHALAAGQLGDVKVCTIQFDRFRPHPRERWRESAIEGAGIWFDLGPHLIDQALLLFGRPISLQARLNSLRDGSKNIDYAHVHLFYADKEVVLRASPYTAGPMLRYEVETTLGTWRKYGLDPQEDSLKNGSIPSMEPWLDDAVAETAQWCTEQAVDIQPIQAGHNMQFYEQVCLFLTGQLAHPPVRVEEALDVVKVLEKAIESERSGCRLAIDW
jgi:scyllo-inositol 2-dehydrogenase (NADP+)